MYKILAVPIKDFYRAGDKAIFSSNLVNRSYKCLINFISSPGINLDLVLHHIVTVLNSSIEAEDGKCFFRACASLDCHSFKFPPLPPPPSPSLVIGLHFVFVQESVRQFPPLQPSLLPHWSICFTRVDSPSTLVARWGWTFSLSSPLSPIVSSSPPEEGEGHPRTVGGSSCLSY